jgi:hypothetical protein
MTIGSILLGVALLVGVGLFVTRPVFVHDPQRRRRMSKRKALTLQKEATLTEIQSLDFDYETGKVADDEYQQQREAYVAEAAELLKQIDALDERFLETEAAPEAVQPAADSSPASELDEIEAAIARRRASAAPDAPPAPAAVAPEQKAAAASGQPGAASFCPQCGQPADVEDRFCAYCGHQLPQPQHA